MIIAILGIGEAGSTLARDLIAAGVQVRGWDPEPRMLPDGLDFASSNPAAASGADIVLSVNWASVAMEVAAEVAPVLQPEQLYADLNTAAPQLKREIAPIIEKTGALFVDAALMDPVPPKGLRTQVYASGNGAEMFAKKMSPLGMPVTFLDHEAGNAATHKLVRSIMYKGVAAVVIECLEAADVVWRAAGTIAIITSQGGSTSVVALSYGERGESGELWKDPNQTVENVKRIRHEEAKTAAEAVGAD